MKRFILTLIVIPFLTLAITGAQENPTASIRVLCFERDPTGLDELAVVNPEKEFQKISFPETFPSQTAKVPVIKGKVYFYNPAKTDGKPVATAAIPSGVKKAFVMFFPAPESEDGLLYQTVVLNASLGKIPKNGALLMNICEEDLRVVIGEHKLALEAGKTATVPRPKKRNDFNMAAVVFLKQEDSEWKVQAETAVRFPEGQQQFFVAFPDQRRDHIQIRAYDLSEY